MCAVLCLLLVMCIVSGCASDSVSGTTTAGITTTVPSSTDQRSYTDVEPTSFRVLYNSDTTHIVHTKSPYNPSYGAPLTAQKLDSSVREAAEAGVDAYSFCPGLCWVPWWPSELFPVVEHIQWFLNTFPGRSNNDVYYDYAFKNRMGIYGKVQHDIVQEQIDSCRKYGVLAIFSYRMNDIHFAAKTDASSVSLAYTSRTQIEHTEWLQSATSTHFDYRFEGYREFRLSMIKEIIQNYELDGFEMDFMRWYSLFNTQKTTYAQRLQIMTDLIKEIRAALDEATARDGRYRHLVAKIPMWTDRYEDMGIDLKAWAQAGVTVFNLSSSYYTVQDSDLAQIKRTVPDTKVFYETYHTVASEGTTLFRRMTAEQLRTTALTAYKQGADGIALFNLQYTRGIPESAQDGYGGMAQEPPFEAVKDLGDPETLAQKSQHYFLWWNYRQGWSHAPLMSGYGLPSTMEVGSTARYDMYMTEPIGGWTTDGLLRIEAVGSMKAVTLQVTINGVELVPLNRDPGEPYDSPYIAALGTASNRKCYVVPHTILKSGQDNHIEIRQVNGEAFTPNYLDLSIQ